MFSKSKDLLATFPTALFFAWALFFSMIPAYSTSTASVKNRETQQMLANTSLASEHSAMALAGWEGQGLSSSLTWVFITRFDRFGMPLPSIDLGATEGITVTQATVNQEGQTLITGSFGGTLIAGSHVVDTEANRVAFLVTIDQFGVMSMPLALGDSVRILTTTCEAPSGFNLTIFEKSATGKMQLSRWDLELDGSEILMQTAKMGDPTSHAFEVSDCSEPVVDIGTVTVPIDNTEDPNG